MKEYTITMTEKEIRRFKHQLSNAVGLLGGNDGTVNTLRDLRDLLEKTIIDSNNTDDFFAIGRPRQQTFTAYHSNSPLPTVIPGVMPLTNLSRISRRLI